MVAMTAIAPGDGMTGINEVSGTTHTNQWCTKIICIAERYVANHWIGLWKMKNNVNNCSTLTYYLKIAVHFLRLKQLLYDKKSC